MNRDCLADELDRLLSEDLASVFDRERTTLDRILGGCDGRCVLFGAGSLGRTALRCLAADGVRPLALSDNNSRLWGSRIDGVPVLSPSEAVSLHGANSAFFVTIWSTGHRYAETHAALSRLGAQQIYPVASIRWKYSGDLLPFFCQDLPRYVYRDADLVRSAFHLWSDDKSRDEYLRQIRYRALGDYLGLSAPDPEPSYFVLSLFSLRPDEVLVDCGAYDGDTIRAFLRLQDGKFGGLIALEPDPRNFEAVTKHLDSLPAGIRGRITVYPYAAAATRGEVRFSADGEMSSAISQNGEILIETIPLDDLEYLSPPTFVKMDIEGAEADALDGGRNLVATHNPILSVCVYHRQSDLWRIPLQIHSTYPGYRHFLRAHEEDGWQTVSYAVPPGRLRNPLPD